MTIDSVLFKQVEKIKEKLRHAWSEIVDHCRCVQNVKTLFRRSKVWNHCFIWSQQFEIFHDIEIINMTTNSLSWILINFVFKIEHKTNKKNSTNAFSKRSNYKLEKEVTFISLLKLIHLTLCKTRETIINLCLDLINCENDEMRHTLTTLTTKFGNEKIDEIISEFLFTLFETIKRHIEHDLIIKVKSMKEPNEFKIMNELIFHDENRIYVWKEVKLRVLKIFHDNSTTKHFEKDKTLISLKKWFYWLKMKNLIKKYAKTYDLCMKTKLSKHFSHEKLLLLSISNRTWSNITINFVTNFLKLSFYKSIDVFDCVMRIVDPFIKMTHYFSCAKTMSSR